MPYTVVDPIEYEARLEKARLAGEISNVEAMRRGIENRKKIDRNWEQARAQEQADRDAAARRRAASQAEIDRDVAETARQKYERDAPERARQAQADEEFRARQESNKRSAEFSEAKLQTERRYRQMRDRQPSSGSSSYPTGQSNPRSGDTISGQAPRGNTPSGTGGNNSGNGGGGTRPTGGSPGSRSPVIEQNRPISNPPWGNGQTSGGQATRGLPPVSAPSGTPPRPTPFSPNMQRIAKGAGKGLIAGIAGEILGRALDPAAKEIGKRLAEAAPWFYGLKKDPKTGKLVPMETPDRDPFDPYRKNGRNAPDPDPNDPYRDPNRPDPSNIPLGPLPGPEYPPGVIGQWIFRVSYYGEWGGYVSRVGTSEVKPVDRIVDGNRQVRLGESVLFNGSVNGPSGIEYFFQPDDPAVKKLPSERPDSEPENLPDPTAPPSPEYAPDKTPAPGVSPSPSSGPEGSPAPSGSPNGSSLPGGDRAPRPELSPDTEKKPGLSPGFVPGFRPDFEPEPSSTPKPKPGMQPQNDPKTDPRKRDLRYFEPSTGTGTTPGTGTGTTPGTATGTTPGTATGTTPGTGTGTGTGTTSPPLLCRYPIASSITIGIFDGFDENGNPKTKNESVTCLPSESARVQLLFRRLFKLESTVFDGQVAIPEAWAVRVGTDRPQLVIVYAELLPSGKLGRSRWSLSVPHYNRGEKASISAPSYRRGTWVGRLALNDGSSLNVNAASSAECKRAINKLKILVPNSFRVNASGKASKPRIAENPDLDFKEVNVVPVTAKFFATGQKTLSPTWNKKLRKST
jgi:hypothetical protein